MNREEMIRGLQILYRRCKENMDAEEVEILLEVLGFLGGEDAVYFPGSDI